MAKSADFLFPCRQMIIAIFRKQIQNIFASFRKIYCFRSFFLSLMCMCVFVHNTI